MIEELLSDKEAMRALVALSVASAVAGLPPSFSTLYSPMVQNGLRSPSSPIAGYLTAWYLIVTVLTLIAGTTGDLIGRKLSLLAALVGLIASNLVNAFALGTPLGIAADWYSDLFPAIVRPLALAIATLLFRHNVRPLAYTVLLSAMGIALGLNAIYVGVLKNVTPLITFIPVLVVAVVSIRLVWKNVPESRAPVATNRATIAANLIMFIGIFGVVGLALTTGLYRQNWSTVIAGIGALWLIAAFIRWLGRRVRAMDDVRLYTGQDVALAIFAGALMAAGQGALLYQMINFFSRVQGIGVVRYVLRFAPLLFGSLAGGLLSARLMVQHGPGRIISGGLVAMALGFLGLGFLSPDTAYLWMVVPITLVGLGMGVIGPPRTQVVLSTPPPSMSGSAATVNTAAGRMGYGLGIVVSSLFITQLSGWSLLWRLKHSSVPQNIVSAVEEFLPTLSERLIAQDYSGLAQPIVDALDYLYALVFTEGLRATNIIIGVAMAVSAGIIVVGMRRGKVTASAYGLDEDPMGVESS